MHKKIAIKGKSNLRTFVADVLLSYGFVNLVRKS